MKAVFADTFYWIALTNPRDGFHKRVLEFSRSFRPQFIVTTDEVLKSHLVDGNNGPAFWLSVYSHLSMATDWLPIR